MDSPYYFIAVPLPEYLKKQFARLQVVLKEYLPYQQWPHPDDLHITLAFLGPVTPEHYQILSRLMASIQEIEAFTLETAMLGTFGNPENPRVLWAGIQYNPALMHLQQTVCHLIEQAGFKPEKRPYKPHITLAKKWAGETKDLSILNTYDTGEQTFKVESVVIYRIYPGMNPKYDRTAVYHLTEEGT